MIDPTFKLEGIVRVKENMEDFEGPLTLILTLLSKNKIEIKDIQISSLLDQYLEYIDKMKSMDLEIASEFVSMASHLVYIKSKSVLQADDEELSELEELKSSLESLQNKDKYSQIKQASEWLDEMYKNGGGTFVKQAEVLSAQFTYNYSHEPQNLLDALERVFRETDKSVPAPETKQRIPSPIVFSIAAKTAEIVSYLREYGVAALEDLLNASRNRSELVATFVSILDLCKTGSIVVFGTEDNYSIALNESYQNLEISEESV